MALKLRPLAEQVIVITGASSGIGLATARMAAARGARVLLVARNRDALAEACRGITEAGGTAAFHVADVGKPEEVSAAADAAVARFGRIDTWVNNAGVTIYAKLIETPLAEHEQLFRTNYFGVVNGCTVAVEHLRERGGALITVGSIGSDLPTPVLGAYAASKHAVKAYVAGLRMELENDGVPISLTLVKPSGIDTPIGQHAANHGDGEALVPPPLYAPELVAETILHAAEHPRRDLTVGGIGRAQVLIGTHFPGLLEWLAPKLAPAVFDRSQPKTESDSLFSSPEGGRERSGTMNPRPFSLYTAAELHPGATAAVGIAAAAGIIAMIALRRRQGR